MTLKVDPVVERTEDDCVSQHNARDSAEVAGSRLWLQTRVPAGLYTRDLLLPACDCRGIAECDVKASFLMLAEQRRSAMASNGASC